VRLDLQVFRPEGQITARGMERLRFAPWGVGGGRAGATGGAVLNPGTPRERVVPKIDLLALEPGDVLSMRTPGGGGNGDPLARPVDAVAADVEAGLVTAAHARAAYGVVIVHGAVDAAATDALRAERRAAAAPAGAFDFGPARDAHERRWPPELQDSLVALLMTLPVPYRAYVRRALHARIAARSDGAPVGPEELTRLWEELAAASGLPARPGGGA
jgi:N-methylhydantoinase B